MLQRFEDHQKATEDLLENIARLSLEYSKRVKEEAFHTPEEIEIMNVGKLDPKKHLESDISDLLASSILQCLGTMIDTVVF
jgi:26S proteasome regulatory subunit N11